MNLYMNSPMSSPPKKPDFCGVLSESKRIINAYPHHFLSLSLLFILPITLSNTFPTLQQQPLYQSKTLTITCIYLGFILVLSLCAAGTIIHSILQGFYDRPVKFMPAIKSLSKSFLPLLVTSIASQALQVVGSFIFGFLLSFVIIIGFMFLWGGTDFSYNSPIFIVLLVVASVFSVAGLVYLQVNWALASVVVVAESSWGFKPLRKSTYLVKGARWVSLSLLLGFAVLTGFLAFSGSALATWLGGGGSSNGWRNLAFLVQMVVIKGLTVWLMLHSIAASTVFYICCKTMHGELASEIADLKYISLPFDDEKANLVSSAKLDR